MKKDKIKYSEWQSVKNPPKLPGWYNYRLPDGKILVRAWINNCWRTAFGMMIVLPLDKWRGRID